MKMIHVFALTILGVFWISALFAAPNFDEEDYDDFFYCIAYANAHFDAVKDFIDRGIDLSYQDYAGRTALHIAALNDRPATIELLINSGARLVTRDFEGNTPLLCAVEQQNLDAMQKLLNFKAKTNVCNNKGLSPMLIARSRYNWYPKIYDALIAVAKKPDFDELSLAALGYDREAVRSLIQKGAKVDAKNSYGWSPLQIAVRNPGFFKDQFFFVATTMLEYSKDLGCLSPQGDNLLNLAAMAGDHWTIRHLIKKGVDPNHQNNKGETPLIQMIKSYNFSYWDSSTDQTWNWVPILLQGGANPNLQDEKGWTALMWAVVYWHDYNTLYHLLYAGADPEMKNNNGDSALDLANELGHEDAINAMTYWDTAKG